MKQKRDFSREKSECLLSLGAPGPDGVSGASEVDKWKYGSVRPVGPVKERHTFHSYFVNSPESPDGRYIIYFSSTVLSGEYGDLRLLVRETGEERILASGIQVEDAHRGACEQWIGSYVVYHDVSSGIWKVIAVDINTGKSRVLAEDRQVGFGSPGYLWLPVYGKHWNPGEHRDLEFVNVETGAIRKPLTIHDVVDAYPEWINKRFNTLDLSIFFPVLSLDGKRVFFKVSSPGNGDTYRGSHVSDREGKLVYDLAEDHFIGMFEEWGHPSWHPDGEQILEKGNFLYNLKTGENCRLSLTAPSNHPSLNIKGDLFVTDANMTRHDFAHTGDWAIIVGSCHDDYWVIADWFNNEGGARSWRKSHPHPVFNLQGNRLYYNVSDGAWTRLVCKDIRVHSG